MRRERLTCDDFSELHVEGWESVGGCADCGLSLGLAYLSGRSSLDEGRDKGEVGRSHDE